MAARSLRLQQRAQAGFTLLELLLAITLMAMILGLAYGGLKSAVTSTSRGEQRIEAAQSVRMVHQFTRRQLNRMVPLAYVNDEQGTYMFEGGNDEVIFVGPMPGYLGFGGSQVQRLRLAPGDDGLELQFSHVVLSGYEDGALDFEEPILLLDGIEDGAFSFITRDETGELMEWSSDWEDPALLPEAVSLELAFPEERNLAFPDLLAVRKATGGIGMQGGRSRLQEHIQRLINQRRAERQRNQRGN